MVPVPPLPGASPTGRPEALKAEGVRAFKRLPRRAAPRRSAWLRRSAEGVLRAPASSASDSGKFQKNSMSA